MASSETEHVRRLYGQIRAVIRSIPRGRVATYGQIAELAGLPGGARIVAAALKTGSQALPWQRVIGKAGPRRGKISILDPVGAAVQRELLEEEGVPVGDAGKIALDVYGWLPSARAAVRAGSARGASPRRRPRSGSKRRASSSRR